MSGYRVRISGKTTRDDGYEADLPATEPNQAWHERPLPRCPDCGGEVVWAEAGNVPGTRACSECRSLFAVQSRDGRVWLRRERLY